jgi:hypothetical protein
LRAKKVELLEKKKAKYLKQIGDWIRGLAYSAKKVKKVICTLNHICLVVPEEHSRMVLLYKFQGGFRVSQF